MKIIASIAKQQWSMKKGIVSRRKRSERNSFLTRNVIHKNKIANKLGRCWLQIGLKEVDGLFVRYLEDFGNLGHVSLFNYYSNLFLLIITNTPCNSNMDFHKSWQKNKAEKDSVKKKITGSVASELKLSHEIKAFPISVCNSADS